VQSVWAIGLTYWSIEKRKGQWHSPELTIAATR
jgi:hypothetical protein